MPGRVMEIMKTRLISELDKFEELALRDMPAFPIVTRAAVREALYPTKEILDAYMLVMKTSDVHDKMTTEPLVHIETGRELVAVQVYAPGRRWLPPKSPFKASASCELLAHITPHIEFLRTRVSPILQAKYAIAEIAHRCTLPQAKLIWPTMLELTRNWGSFEADKFAESKKATQMPALWTGYMRDFELVHNTFAVWQLVDHKAGPTHPYPSHEQVAVTKVMILHEEELEHERHRIGG